MISVHAVRCVRMHECVRVCTRLLIRVETNSSKLRSLSLHSDAALPHQSRITMDTNKLNQLWKYFVTPCGSYHLRIFWCSYSLNNAYIGAITKCRSLYYSVHPNNHQLIVDMTFVTKIQSFGSIFKRRFGGCIYTGRFVPTLLLEVYRYGFLACTDIRYWCNQKKPITDSRSDICINILRSKRKCTFTYRTTTCACIHCLWWYTAWVSIVQSGQLGAYKHFYVYSHEWSALLRILMTCEKAGTASFLG